MLSSNLVWLMVLQCLIPVVMSGIIAVYSLVISVLIAQDLSPPSQQKYDLFTYVIRQHNLLDDGVNNME